MVDGEDKGDTSGETNFQTNNILPNLINLHYVLFFLMRLVE